MKATHLLLAWSAAFLAWGGSGFSAASAAEPVRKVVRQYAVTSANDFPQRDPQDWRLLASNDGGRTWTTLDVRKGETFSERQQRRLFALSNRAAFNLYRLQIDRVRDPSGADSVQLAEIEAMGETEDDLDPTPTSADLIAAQGDKAPVEIAYNAFDGRIETKWLDFAPQNPGSRSSWIQWQYASPDRLVITNLEQLSKLRARARQGCDVRIEGVVVGRSLRTNALWFLDPTGSLEVPGIEAGEQFLPGQRVLLEGTSQWTNRQAAIRQPRLHLRGPRAAPEPRPLALEQPLTAGEDLQWVEAEGQVGFFSRVEGRLVFDLVDGERVVSVRVLQPGLAGRQSLPEGRVRVRGLCQGLLSGKGKAVAGLLWVPSLAEVVPITAPPLAARSTVGAPSALSDGQAVPFMTDIGSIRRLGPEELASKPRVKIRGVAIFGDYIHQGTECIETRRGEEEMQLGQNFFGDYLEAEGKAVWVPGHGPVVKAEQIRFLGKGKLPRPDRPSWNELASGKGIRQWIELDGVVRATDGSHLLLDCDGGQLMATIRTARARVVEGLVDAAVTVRGVAIAATNDRGQVQGIQLLVPSLEFVEVKQEPTEAFSLPVRPIGSLLQVKSPQDLTHRVKIEGVLTCQDGRRCFLQDATGSAMALGKEDVILRTPGSPWHWVFWQSPSTHTTPKNHLDLQVGDKLQVVGFPEQGGEAPVLTEALIRKVAHSNPMPPVATTLEDILLGRHDAALVSLEGRLLGREIVGRDLVLELQGGGKVFQAVLRASDRAFPNLATGSRVRVTGACEIEPLPYAELGKRVGAFKVLLRSLADIVILERPPWWDMKHTLMAGGALAATLAATAAWIWILRQQVGERTTRLLREIEEHQKTEGQLAEETRRVQSEIEEHKCTERSLAEKTELLRAEVEERRRVQTEFERVHRQLLVSSRLAGMAEVATSVLHNVGNVLNGTNILASSIERQIQQSEAPGVSRLAAFLTERQADLGRFLSQDGQGQLVCGHLERLGAQLTAEQSRLVEKTKLLSESIQHLKEIVAMQQNFAGIYGVTETVSPTAIVEDAIQMCSTALGWPGIEIVRDYEDVPPATLDRHRVLQVLFNLLENARYACEARGSGCSRIVVRLRLHGHDRVCVQVTDNGIGIAPENLPRIFTQGFSTRKGGHGFGLHSSILAAQDLGGSLTVHSDGPGLGAVFTLELPLAGRAPAPGSASVSPAAKG